METQEILEAQELQVTPEIRALKESQAVLVSTELVEMVTTDDLEPLVPWE